MKGLLSILMLSIASFIQAQSDVFLHIKAVCGNQPVVLQTNVTSSSGQVFNVEHFNYYVSDMVLYHDGGTATMVSPSVFIFTPDIQGYYLGNYSIQQLDSIRFMVGVPSRLNTQQGSEAQDISSYPMSHPLSFQSPSMYWGWQFGYMHMVVGGNADSNNDQQVDAYFELHNLGDHNQRVVEMPVVATQTTMNQKDVYLECHLDQLLRNIPLDIVGILHGETGLNDTVMANVNGYPVFVQPQNAGINQNITINFFLYENTVYLENTGAQRLVVLDYLGRKMQEFKIEGSKVNFPLDLSEGMYVLSLYGPDNTCNGSRKCRILQP